MVEKISLFFYRIASTRKVLLGLVLYILFPAVLLRWVKSKADPEGIGLIPDLSFGFTPEQVYGMLDSMGESGRQYYLLGEAVIDVAYPGVYACLLGILLSLQMRRIFPAGSRWRLLNFTPVLAGLFDFAENANILIMLANFSTRPELPAQMASLMNQGKWIFLGSSVLMLVVLLAVRLIRRGSSAAVVESSNS